MSQTNLRSIWNNPQYRAVFFQTILIILLVLVSFYLINNTLYNLESRGIHTGFAFLDFQAGFDILQSLVDYSSNSTYGRTFIVGLLNTILVSAIAISFATILGFVIGVARLSSNWIVAKIALVYVETFRNIPLLLQIIFWYHILKSNLPVINKSFSISDLMFINNRGFYLPKPIYEAGFNWVFWIFCITIIISIIIKIWAKKYQEQTGKLINSNLISLGIIIIFTGITFIIQDTPLHFEIPVKERFNFAGGMVLIPELAAMILALSIYTASFIAEIVRSGILSVQQGQKEAALALGLRPKRVLNLVIIPQAMRVIIPQLTSQYLNLTKNSSLSTAVGYPDLVTVFMGTTLNQTGQAVEIVAMTMAVYLTLSLSISLLMNYYNRRNKHLNN